MQLVKGTYLSDLFRRYLVFELFNRFLELTYETIHVLRQQKFLLTFSTVFMLT